MAPRSGGSITNWQPGGPGFQGYNKQGILSIVRIRMPVFGCRLHDPLRVLFEKKTIRHQPVYRLSDSVKVVKDTAAEIDVITGAGIKNAVDAKKALELGTRGIFVASGIIKAVDQKKAILDLVGGLKQ